MKAKYTLVMLAMTALLILGATVACTKGRTDAQIASDVQNKIYSDAAVQSRQVSVQSANGAVTLTGTVDNQSEWQAASNDAMAIPGVKTVQNNLQVTPPAAAEQQPPEQEQPKAEEQPAKEVTHARREARRREEVTPGQRRPSAMKSTPTPAPEPVENAALPATMPAPPPKPVEPPPPVKVTIPDGTTFSIRMVDSVDSETAQAGQTFRASLDSPIVVDGNVVVPAGADILGRVVEVKSAGRFAGKSDLAVELTKLSYNGHTYSLHTTQYSREGSSRGATTAKRVGAGAAIGALIGGLAGGGKGAAIGATVGAGAGGGVTAAGKGQQIKLSSEQVLVFTLQSPLTVTAASGIDRNTQRRRLDE